MAETKIDFIELVAPAFYTVLGDVFRERHSEYWLDGGRGSTKSSFFSLEIILGLLRDPLASAIIYRKVANTIKDSVFSQMIWAIDTLGLNGYFRIRKSPFEITYKPTGQRIMFRGADDPLKSKSIKLTYGYFKYLWFEELTEFYGMEEVRTIQQSVIRGVDKAFTFYSYNPPRSMQNWTNEESLKKVPNRLVHHSTYLDVPPEWLGNAFIERAESLKISNERAYRNEYLGEITGMGGQVFDNLKLDPITDEQIQSFDKCYNGLDFGFAVDPDAFVRCYYDKRTTDLFIFDEFYSAQTTADRLAEEIKKRAGREIVTCDSADPRMIDEMRRRGIQAVGARKGPGSVEHGMRWLQERHAIVIDKQRCPNAAREYGGYEYPQDKNGNFLAAYPDANNHILDGTRYAVQDIATQRIATTCRFD